MSDSMAVSVAAQGYKVLIQRVRPAQLRPGPLLAVFASFVDQPETNGPAAVRPETIRPEFAGQIVAAGRPALVIHDFGATWFGRPDSHALILATVRHEMADLGSDQIDTLGFSMGAFGALAIARDLPVRHAVALSPRHSLSPRVGDSRRRPSLEHWAGRLIWDSVAPGMHNLGRALVLHGAFGPDRPHLALFREAPQQVERWILPLSGHFVTTPLARQRVMGAVIQAGLAGNNAAAARALRAVHALRAQGVAGRLWHDATRVIELMPGIGQRLAKGHEGPIPMQNGMMEGA